MIALDTLLNALIAAYTSISLILNPYNLSVTSGLNRFVHYIIKREPKMDTKNSWYNIVPPNLNKNLLVGAKLRVLEDHPPEKTTKSGLYEIELCVMEHFNTVNSDKQKILVPASGIVRTLITSRDLDKICSLAKEGKAFTFYMGEGDWASVMAA